MKGRPSDIADIPAFRRALMARIRGKDTTPELIVRRWLHAAGYRFRLHRSDLAGRPDIVLPRFKLALFVHGCFWHRHPGCRRATLPKTRASFWEKKLTRNVERDRQNQEELVRLGWRVEIIWECEIKTAEQLERRLHEILNASISDKSENVNGHPTPRKNNKLTLASMPPLDKLELS